MISSLFKRIERFPSTSANYGVRSLSIVKGKQLICSSSYGDSFSIVSYAYASQFYDAYAFYHKAYSIQFLVINNLSLMSDLSVERPPAVLYNVVLIFSTVGSERLSPLSAPDYRSTSSPPDKILQHPLYHPFADKPPPAGSSLRHWKADA